MSQSISNILLHLIFNTKNRLNLIDNTLEILLYSYITQICEIQKCPLITIGGTENHLHLLLSLSRSITVAKLVNEIKSSSSLWIKTKGEKYAHFAWQQGYGIFSIGRSNLQQCIHYIKNQKQHHKKLSFQNELREILKKYDMVIEEKYLWN